MVELLAPAKVNLCLRVFGKAKSGFHNLDSIIVFCEFGDKIHIQQADSDAFHVTGPFAPMLNATDSRHNIVIKARDAFRRNGGVCGPVSIHLEKQIPVGAGLGGGSADAAATLRGLNTISKNPLRNQRLFSLSAELGSDVPVCLSSTPHQITGTGAVIHKLKKIHAGALLLINPLIPLSTATVFQMVSPPYNKMLPKIIDQEASVICKLGNDLEAVSIRLVPQIADILDRLRDLPCCLAAQMSGSGASCFGIFNDLKSAKVAEHEFQQAGYWTKPTKLCA